MPGTIDVPAPSRPFRDALREAAAGGGMGLLVGFLVGLSISPVVGALLAALTALLAAFLGLADKVPGGSEPRETTAWRIAAFGLACTLGVALGIGVRANNLLSKSPSARVKAWTDAGFSKDRAQELVALAEFGPAPESGAKGSDRLGAGVRNSLLFAGDPETCTQLDRQQYATGDDRRQAFLQIGGPWRDIAKGLEAAGSADRERAIEAAWQLACAPATKR